MDVIPVLRPKIRRSAICKVVEELEAASNDDYHPAINWLDRHRFYLNQEECDRINASLERIQSEPMDEGEIRIQWENFSPNPGMDESYIEDEPN